MLTMDTLPRIGVTAFEDMKALMMSLRELRGLPPEKPETLQARNKIEENAAITPRREAGT